MHQKRDGEHSARECQWGTMEKIGVTYTHKHFGIKGCAFCCFNFHQDVPKQVYSCSNVQYGSSHICSKNGKHHQPGSNESCKINLILSPVESNYSYSRVFAGVSQHKADHVLRRFQDRSEWLLWKKTFQKICQEWGQSNTDLFTASIFHQVPAYVMELGLQTK